MVAKILAVFECLGVANRARNYFNKSQMLLFYKASLIYGNSYKTHLDENSKSQKIYLAEKIYLAAFSFHQKLILCWIS